ncbi:hypothetical protein [Crocosphaera sp. XPORK-15E]|uniref:hypothetical protein n=1 Tax=Crocosphaera sp. XPORK-15E TaxID=3110247 RepID=UPI002B1F086C|nr:hypothetical protein [Crocosphaera sp. XPORK-15E]MEA5537340.1 hypothetical protein [Crocosphaera sp. XPORK-15E]
MNWYLVTVRPNKRDSFLKQLDFAIEKNQLAEIFLSKISPTVPMYKDMVLMEVSNLKSAPTHLREIEHFQRIESRALSPETSGAVSGEMIKREMLQII